MMKRKLRRKECSSFASIDSAPMIMMMMVVFIIVGDMKSKTKKESNGSLFSNNLHFFFRATP